jgi:hypothetical protein
LAESQNEPRKPSEENAWEVIRPDVIRLWKNLRGQATALTARAQARLRDFDAHRPELPSQPWSNRDRWAIGMVSIVVLGLLVFNVHYGGTNYLFLLVLPPIMLVGALFTDVEWVKASGLFLGTLAAIAFGALVSSNDIPALFARSLQPSAASTFQEVMRNEPVEFVRFLRTLFGLNDAYQLAAILLTATALYVLMSLHALAWGLKDLVTARTVKVLDYPYLLLAGYGLIDQALPLLASEPDKASKANLFGLYALALALAIRITKASIEVFRWHRSDSPARQARGSAD